MDFMDISSIPACWKITQEFHTQKREDVLQIRSTLWYCWKSLTIQLEELASQPMLEDSTRQRKRRHNYMRRHGQATEALANQQKRMRLSKTGKADDYDNVYKFTCPHAKCHGIRQFHETGFKSHV